MIKILLVISIFITNSLLIGKTTNNTSLKKLKEYNRKLGEFDNKLSAISTDIFKEREAITSINLELKKIDSELSKEKRRYFIEKKKAERLKKESGTLSVKQKDLRSQVLVTSTKLISLSIITDHQSENNLKSIILDEVFNILSRENVRKLKKFDLGLSKRQSKIDVIQKKMDTLKESIEKVENKKKLIKEKKSSREKMFNRLNAKKFEYKKYLKEIVSKQKKIKIEIEKAQAQMERERAAKRVSKRRQSYKNTITTHIGSSYKKEAVKRYRGKKTISPIKNYKVITKFGTYIDPIYKFKIFSSSVLLKPNKNSAKVRNIFNGKITLFKDDKTLGKFVMIEHFNGLQTMYAHLDSFAPSIRAGKKIKKGTVIGRVSEKLYFEVMEKNYRIDPLEVIK